MASWKLRSDTRNPETIFIERESRSCKGCIHKGAAWGISWCLKFEKTANKKCARYKEKE